MHFRGYDAPMPTLNPRITITLDESTALQLRRLSELTGNSQSKLVSELLQESGPVFSRTIVVLEAAQRAKEALKTGSAARLSSAQGRVEAELGVALPEPFDTSTLPLFGAVENIARRGSRRRPPGPEASTVEERSRRARGAAKVPQVSHSAPLSNRGVRSNKKGAAHGPV